MKYFENFPLIPYTFDPKFNDVYILTNIFTRVKFLDSILNNINVYYAYSMQDHDTFESIADKYYGDVNRYWIILFANLILDPNYQAPLNYVEFQNYMTNKYGSLAASQGIIDHYEKRIVTTITAPDLSSTITTSTLYYSNTVYSIVDDVSGDVITNFPTIAFPTMNLTSPDSVIVGGDTSSSVIQLQAISAYDNEFIINQSKRNIQLPKKEYSGQIEAELLKLLTNSP
jgi:hypothetical protein